MFCEIKNNDIKQINVLQFNEETIYAGYLSLEEFKGCYNTLGIPESILNECENDNTHFRNSVDIYDDFTFGIINIIDIMNVNAPKDRMGFIIKKNMFILIKLVDDDESTADFFLNAIKRCKSNPTLEKVIYGILERLLVNGNKKIEITEKTIMSMEKIVVEGKLNMSLNKDIFEYKNELTVLKNYYEHLIDIGEELQENENDLFENENLRYFKMFTDKVSRLSANTQVLCDSLIHLREALDAALNYDMNRIMKVLTIITATFLPLTLIAGWYGMNFKHMPELSWKFSYLGVFILSIIIVVIMLTFFRKKKFF